VLILSITVLASLTLPGQSERVIKERDLIVWGASSNGLRAGIFCPKGKIDVDSKSGANLTEASLVIGSVVTNKIYFYLPKAGHQDRLELTDQSGASVPRTPAGEAAWLGPPDDPVKSRKGYATCWLKPGDHIIYGIDSKHGDLNLSARFFLTNLGSYTLSRRAYICIEETNGLLRPILLPPVSVPVRVK
jgi:hypothetical protein